MYIEVCMYMKVLAVNIDHTSLPYCFRHYYLTTILISYLAGDERMSRQQEDLETEEPSLLPSDHHVAVGNLLVIHSYIKQHDGWNNIVLSF